MPSRLSLVVSSFAIALISMKVWKELPHIKMRGSRDKQWPYHVYHDIFTEAELENLYDLLHSSEFVSTTSAYSEARHEHIGESEPVVDGKCSSPYLIPNKNRTECILPERVDVAIHQFISGGIDSLKEKAEVTTSRLIVNQKYYHSNFGETEIPAVKQLFESENYLKQAKAICEMESSEKDPILDPMMLAMIIALPGQMVAMHYDLPWFYGADRWDFPGWFLVAMHSSGLFDDIRIPQVQGVAYLHTYNTTTDNKRGGFYFFPNGTGAPYQVQDASRNTAIICDGTRMVHGTQTFQKEVVPPPLRKDSKYGMRYIGEQKWEFYEFSADSSQKEVVRVYDESDLRITLVWRQRCFRDTNELNRFRDRSTKRLDLQETLDRMVSHLVATRKMAGRPSTAIKTAFALIEHYTRYPFSPDHAIPYNYCTLEMLLPENFRPYMSALGC
jgi:hypothetical protein